MLLAHARDRLLTPGRQRVVIEFLRFGVVGTAGFIVDAAVLYGALAFGAGLYAGRVASYIAAATTTWALNRIWTFRSDDQQGALGRQWALFLLVNLVGFTVNYGTYALLVGQVPVVAAHPILGVAAGSLAGMGGNFVLSRRYVFRTGQASGAPGRG
jgi:putative flippase GtrA